MSTEETFDQVSGQEVFDEAIAKEPKEVEAKVEETQPEAKADEGDEGRARDEKGRFIAKTEDVAEATPEPTQEARIDNPVTDEKPDHRIPLTELLNEREKRQNAERERQAYQQQLWQLQQQLQQAQAKPEEPIDIFADPDAYRNRVEQTMEQRLKAMEGNFSLRLAAYKHGEVFGEAWQEMIQRTQMGDDSLRQQVLQSPDPGEALVQLYQREKVVKEVGPDPVAYRSKVLDEALKDPQFLAKALEAARGVAGTQPTQQINLPPSVNKAAAARDIRDGESGDRGLYDFATR